MATLDIKDFPNLDQPEGIDNMLFVRGNYSPAKTSLSDFVLYLGNLFVSAQLLNAEIETRGDADTEMLSRLLGTSTFTNANTDPQRKLGAYTTFDDFVSALDTAISSTSQSYDGHLFATVNGGRFNIIQQGLFYANSQWLQVVFGNITVDYENGGDLAMNNGNFGICWRKSVSASNHGEWHDAFAEIYNHILRKKEDLAELDINSFAQGHVYRNLSDGGLYVKDNSNLVRIGTYLEGGHKPSGGNLLPDPDLRQWVPTGNGINKTGFWQLYSGTVADGARFTQYYAENKAGLPVGVGFTRTSSNSQGWCGVQCDYFVGADTPSVVGVPLKLTFWARTSGNPVDVRYGIDMGSGGADYTETENGLQYAIKKFEKTFTATAEARIVIAAKGTIIIYGIKLELA